jgi:hypothetical protein
MSESLIGGKRKSCMIGEVCHVEEELQEQNLVLPRF